MYPLDHQLVPTHRKATADDLKMLPAGALRRRSCLPAIRLDDVVVQYLDAGMYSGSTSSAT